MSLRPNRRQFIGSSLVAGAALGLLRERAWADEPAAGKVVIGVIGTGGRGTALAGEFAGLPNAEVRYLCDVDDAHAAGAAKMVEQRQKSAPKVVKDLHQVLADKEVEAVVVATPDHWHAPAAILACAAGKHVYVEKPCCHNPREGELLVEAAAKHKRLVQHGTQRRSWSRVIEALQKVRGGEIGKVRFSRGWYTNNRPETGKRTPAAVPAGFDWELWQGPAPRRPFAENIVPYKWHWYWNWGTGELGNNGIHSLDLCRVGLGVEVGPERVTAGGGRYYFKDDQETPDTLNVTYDFGEQGVIVWEGRSCQPSPIEGSGFGAAFYGDKGAIVIDANNYKVLDPAGKVTATIGGEPAPESLHTGNFLAAIRGQAKLASPIEEGVKGVMLCHLGNIAYRTGRVVNLDPRSHRITGDKDQAALWQREYAPGQEPKV